MNVRTLLRVAVSPVVLSACYQAELDPSISGVYVCADHVDCAIGNECLDGVCVATANVEGPVLQIAAPQQLEIFPIDNVTAVPLIVAGRNLNLDMDESEDPLGGYIEIQLDGAVVDSVASGSLEDGIEIDSLPLPQAPGLHHLRVVARRADGELFDSEGAAVTVGFWVDDGKEHIGILTPAPSDRVPLFENSGVKVEIASLNFTLVNPGFSAPADATMPGLGYAHLYVDADLPSCLPGCNLDYQTTLMPAGLSRVNRITSEQPIDLAADVGTIRLQVVAQTLANAPYHQDGGVGDVVFYSLPVQAVVGESP